MDAKQALAAAADLIEQKGWLQGSYGSDRIGYCILGAINAVTDSWSSDEGFATDMAACELLDDILERAHGEGSGTVAIWNDHPGRTKDEVLQLLRHAAGRGN